MTYSLINQATGKEMKIPDKAAREFFGAFEGTKKIICLPCSQEADVSGETAPNIYEVKKFRKKKKIPGTCVIRMGGIGDLIMLSSGVRELIARGEKVQIATLPRNVAFVKALGFKAFSVEDIGRYEFEKVIDLRFAVEPRELGSICKGSWEDYTLKDRTDVFDELLGVFPARKRFEVPVSKAAVETIEAAILPGSIAINVSIVASARSIKKEYVMPICSQIVKCLGKPVVLFGVSQPWNHELTKISMSGVINLINKTTTDEMIALCSLAEMIITPDTGSLHVAAALGKKTLALFGNINPRTRISYYPTVRPLYPQGELPCVPCWDLHPCVKSPEEGVKCMALVSSPDRVVNAVRELGGY